MTLPAFLLACANRNLVWLGFKKLALPAVNARWSLARVIALTAVHTALGVGLGSVISLLAAGRLLGWLLWLFGVLTACQGVVCFGLTALCWNQRVARLKQNPNLPLRLPPARYVLFRWALGLFYFALLAVITPLAMLVTMVNIRGQLAWKHERARLVAQGERLTFRDIVGPEIPAAENAGAAPIFAPFFDYPPSSDIRFLSEEMLRPRSSNAVARIQEQLRLPFNHLPGKPKDAPKTRKEDLADWSAAYREQAASPTRDDPSWAAELKLPSPGDAVRDVLAGLNVADTVVAEICAAAARPRAQFAVHWDEGFRVSLPHLSVLKGAQQNLNLRCAAHLAAGETDTAFAVATNALNVAELLREEPLLVSQLVRIAQGAVAIRTLWQGLVEHRWTDAQLAAFQERLGRMDYQAGLIRGFEGERACGIAFVDALIAGSPGFGQSTGSLRRAAMLVPLGGLRLNQMALVRQHTAMLADLRDHVAKAPQIGFGTFTAKRLKNERVEPYSPFTVMAKMLVPASAKTEARAVRAQTTIQLAITACALERYRLAHGGFPETLDALAPAFLPKPPLDPMTGQPFHYRRTDDGRFLLYSVGEDGKDDGGVFGAVKRNDPGKDLPWPVPTRPETRSLF
jgi:hypothetical protein